MDIEVLPPVQRNIPAADESLSIDLSNGELKFSETASPIISREPHESVAPIVIKTSPNCAPVVVNSTVNGRQANRARKSLAMAASSPLKTAGPPKPGVKSLPRPLVEKKKTPKEKPPAPITMLVRALTHPQTGLYPGGTSPKQLLDYLNSVNPSDMQTTKNQLQVQLCRQANRGYLVRLQTGCYTTPDLVAEIQASGKMPKPPAGIRNRKQASPDQHVSHTVTVPAPTESLIPKIGFRPVDEDNSASVGLEEDRPKRKVKPSVRFLCAF